jgi:hypothetical protein
MPHLKMQMWLLNTRHVASGTRGVADLIFSKPISTVEHEQRLESTDRFGKTATKWFLPATPQQFRAIKRNDLQR